MINVSSMKIKALLINKYYDILIIEKCIRTFIVNESTTRRNINQIITYPLFLFLFCRDFTKENGGKQTV